jgi:hypothetical protein
MSLKTLMYLRKWISQDVKSLSVDDPRFKIKVRQLLLINKKITDMASAIGRQSTPIGNYHGGF